LAFNKLVMDCYNNKYIRNKVMYLINKEKIPDMNNLRKKIVDEDEEDI
jgi:hypothetical protein